LKRSPFLLLIWFLLGIITWLTDTSYFYNHPNRLINSFDVSMFSIGWYTVIIFFLIITKREKIVYKKSEDKQQMNASTVILLYLLSIIVPLTGIFVYLILALKNKANYRSVGRNCLIFSVFNLIFSVMTLQAYLWQSL